MLESDRCWLNWVRAWLKRLICFCLLFEVINVTIITRDILGDPGAVTGGGKKSKRVRKKFRRRKDKNVLYFSSPEFFPRSFKLFAAPAPAPAPGSARMKPRPRVALKFISSLWKHRILAFGTMNTGSGAQLIQVLCYTFLLLPSTNGTTWRALLFHIPASSHSSSW